MAYRKVVLDKMEPGQATLDSAFPTLQRHLELTETGLGGRSLHPVSAVCEKLIRSIIGMQKELANSNSQQLFSKSKELMEQVRHALIRCEGDTDTIALEFVQFLIATGVLSHCMGTGKSQRAGEWVIASLSEEFPWTTDGNGIPDLPRLERFLDAGNLGVRNAPSIEFHWFNYSFSLFTIMGGYVELANLLLPFVKSVVLGPLDNDSKECIDAMISVASWCARNNIDSTEIVRHLESLLNVGHPSTTHILAALCGRIASYSSRSAPEWAQSLYSDFAGSASVGQRLLATLVLASQPGQYRRFKDELWAVFAEVIADEREVQRIDQMQFRERNLRQAWGTVMDLCDRGETREAFEFLQRWFSVTNRVSVDTAFCVPVTSGMLWSHDGLVERTAIERQTEAVKILNLAIGSAFSDGFGGALVSLDRPGFVDPSYGDRLLELTIAHFGIDSKEMARFLRASAAVTLHGLPFPLQGAMIASLGSTLPISISLTEPARQRTLKAVGIWCSPVLHGDTECAEIRRLFEGSGAHVTVEMETDAADTGRFGEFYARDDLDVVWVIGHGRKHPYAPDENNLGVLGLDVTDLDIGYLADAVIPGDHQRLLVLNVCSGSYPSRCWWISNL